jgi:uncharacterized protein DUF4339
MRTVDCPQCQHRMKAPDEVVGKKAKCGECGFRFVVGPADPPILDVVPQTSFVPTHPDSSPPPLWYYAAAGGQKGPLSRPEVSQLIRSGTMNRETSVWCDGMDDWKPAGESALKSEFAPVPIVPPPLGGKNVPNGLAWALAFVPLLDVIALGNVPWSIFFGINTVLCFFDQRRLKKAGHQAPWTAWIFFVPVYLFVRASKARQRPSYAWVWIACFVLSIAFDVAISAAQ